MNRPATFLAALLLAAPAASQVMQLTGAGTGSPVVPDPSLSFVSCTSAAAGTTITYTAHNTGTEAASRLTVVGVVGEDSFTAFGVNSVSVGGDAATQAVDEDGSGLVNSAIFYLANPVGTAEDIVVTWSEALNANTVICVWALYDLTSSTPSSTIADDEANLNGNALVLNHNTQAKGISVGICISDANSDQTNTWVGLTERNDTEVGGVFQYSAADLVAGSASTPLTTSCTWGASIGDDGSGSVAHWR